jgi:diadenylate cyclase
VFEGLYHLFESRPALLILRDVADVFIVAYVLYRALLVLRGTRAMQMGVGLGVVFLVYFGAGFVGLATLLSLLSWLLSSIILVVVVVFQNDIRRALIRMGGSAWLGSGREQQSRVIDEVVAAATELARHRMGAIIAFEQDANILEFVKSEGITLEATVTRELLVSLFVPESVNKLHDGAVLIRDLKIARAGVFFPMPEAKTLDASLGSRHRAALGITEETDAVVVVVSEERGTISFCFSGNIVSNLDGQALRQALLGLFGRTAKKKAPRRPPTAATSSARHPRPTVLPPSPATATPLPLPAPSKLPGAVTPSSTRPLVPAVDRPPPERTATPMPPSVSGPLSTRAFSAERPAPSPTFLTQASTRTASVPPPPPSSEPAPKDEP